MSEMLIFLQIAPTPLLGVVLYAVWKLDRRLLKVEIILHGSMEK